MNHPKSLHGYKPTRGTKPEQEHERPVETYTRPYLPSTLQQGTSPPTRYQERGPLPSEIRARRTRTVAEGAAGTHIPATRALCVTSNQMPPVTKEMPPVKL
jgi:hypothetical protein